MRKLITTITTTITVDITAGAPSAEAVQAGTSTTGRTVTVYSFDELSPEAQARVIDREREHREQSWDVHDRDEIALTIVYGLAEKLGTPGRENGEYDFPGIDGVELDGWDIERGSIAMSGKLTRENAPALPWIDTVREIELISKHSSDYTIVHLADVELECTCPPDAILAPHEPGCLSLGVIIHDTVKHDQLEQAVNGALSDAVNDGQKEWEYRTGEEAARERIESKDDLFTEDGDPHV